MYPNYCTDQCLWYTIHRFLLPDVVKKTESMWVSFSSVTVVIVVVVLLYNSPCPIFFLLLYFYHFSSVSFSPLSSRLIFLFVFLLNLFLFSFCCFFVFYSVIKSKYEWRKNKRIMERNGGKEKKVKFLFHLSHVLFYLIYPSFFAFSFPPPSCFL